MAAVLLLVADTGSNPRGGVWAADGTIVFGGPETAGLSRVSGSGGKPTPLTTLDKSRAEASHRWPDLLPGGQWVLFTIGLEDAPYDEARIEAVSLATGERRGVLSNASFARYSPDGRLLFVRGGHLHAVGFDLDRLTVQGTPEVVLDPVRYNRRNGGSHVAVSASGALLYGLGEPTSSECYLSWVDREGRLSRVSDTPRPFRNVRASPDGRRIATVIGTSTESDLWLVDANRTLTRLSFDLSPHRPTWTSNGGGITVGAKRTTSGVCSRWPPTARASRRSCSEARTGSIQMRGRAMAGSDLPGEPAGDGLGSQGARVRRVRPTRWPAADVHQHAVSRNECRDLVRRPTDLVESDELDGLVQIYLRSFPDGANKIRCRRGCALAGLGLARQSSLLADPRVRCGRFTPPSRAGDWAWTRRRLYGAVRARRPF